MSLFPEPASRPNWTAEAARIARSIRLRSLETAIRLNGAYLGQSCSAAEILATLFLRHVNRQRGDLVVISPAHYCLALYAVMVEMGELSEDAFLTYNQDGSKVEMIGGTGAPGMPFTTGSLAQGLSQAIGTALARRKLGRPGQIYVYVSDGELQEGQTWEAFMSLGHHRLANITVILDVNYSQVDGDPRGILDFDPIHAKLTAFNLDCVDVDGHDLEAIDAALSAPATGKPRILNCLTSISQGLPSISDRANLHFVRFRDGEAAKALADLEAN
jgi:transketolase